MGGEDSTGAAGSGRDSWVFGAQAKRPRMDALDITCSPDGLV